MKFRIKKFSMIILVAFFSILIKADEPSVDCKTVEKQIKATKPNALYQDILKKFSEFRDAFVYFHKNKNKQGVFLPFTKKDEVFRNYFKCVHAYIKTLPTKQKATAQDRVQQMKDLELIEDDLISSLTPDDVKKYLQRTYSIYLKNLAVASQLVTKIPDTWKKSVMQATADAIFPNYKQFFTDYQQAKKTYTSDVIRQFLNKQKLIDTKTNDTELIRKQLGTLTDSLEKLHTRLKADKKKTLNLKTRSELKKNIEISNELIKEIKTIYLVETSLMREKIKLLTDIATILLLGESSGLEYVLRSYEQ